MRKVARVLFTLVFVAGLLVTLVALLGVAAAARFGAYTGGGTRQLNQEKQALQREGVPLTAAEMQQPLPPADENAAPIYQKLSTLLRDKPLADIPLVDLGREHLSTPTEDAAARRILTERTDVVSLVHEAASKPRCVYLRDWSDSRTDPANDIGVERVSARILRPESYLLAKEGRFPEAIQNQALGFRVAEHAASDHTIISYLVGVACESITLSGMDQILQIAGPRPGVDLMVAETIRQQRPQLDLHSALAGEPYRTTLEIQAPNSSPGLRDIRDDGGLLRDVGPQLSDAMIAESLQWQRRFLEDASVPEPERLAAFRQTAVKLQRQASAAAKTLDPRPSLAFENTSFYLHAEEDEAGIRARENVSIASAAVLAYRGAHGNWPARLDQAIQPAPLDPFTYQPLGYRVQGSGFVVYSVGRTGRFHGLPLGAKRNGKEAYVRYPEPGYESALLPSPRS